jgi:hypothetical protein
VAIAAPPPAMNVLVAWPLFTAYDTTGYPLIGGRLHTMAANTTTPKASYADPYGLTPNQNPVILDAMGQAVVWLDGFYHLRLEDRYGVTRWTVDNYEYPAVAEPPAPGMISGMNEGTVDASTGAGTGVLQVPNLIPLGYRVKGVICKVNTPFGTSNALASILIGDSTLADGWGTIGLTAGLATGQVDFHRGDQPIAATAYTILLSAVGGNFDAVGSMSVRAFWESITGWA